MNADDMEGTMNTTQEDIRDIEMGSKYWTITDPDRGGRCVMAGMFIAAWRTKEAAKKAAVAMVAEGTLKKGYAVVPTIKD